MNPPVQTVGSWPDFLTPLFTTALQVGGAYGGALLLKGIQGNSVSGVTQVTQPVQTAAALTQAQSGQWIQGVDNSIVIGGAIGVFAITAILISRR